MWPLVRGARRRAHTRYAITTRRVVIVVGGRRPAVTTLDLEVMPGATLTARRDGTGTIAFGGAQIGPFLPARRMRRREVEPWSKPLAEFELIPDARRVYGLVVDARRALRAAV